MIWCLFLKFVVHFKAIQKGNVEIVRALLRNPNLNVNRIYIHFYGLVYIF